MRAPRRLGGRTLLAGALALGPAAIAGCAHRPAPGDPAALAVDALEVRVDLATIPGDFLARQRLEGAMGERRLASEVILQKQGDTLTLIGLTPFGTKAFAVIQRGLEVSSEVFLADPGDAIPFPPELMLADIHRALFLGHTLAALDTGTRRYRRGEERIIELWVDGRLRRRELRRRRGRGPRGTIAIEYGDGIDLGALTEGSGLPPTITLDNQRLGYTVTISTVLFQPL